MQFSEGSWKHFAWAWRLLNAQLQGNAPDSCNWKRVMQEQSFSTCTPAIHRKRKNHICKLARWGVNYLLAGGEIKLTCFILIFVAIFMSWNTSWFWWLRVSEWIHMIYVLQCLVVCFHIDTDLKNHRIAFVQSFQWKILDTGHIHGELPMNS